MLKLNSKTGRVTGVVEIRQKPGQWVRKESWRDGKRGYQPILLGKWKSYKRCHAADLRKQHTKSDKK